MLERKAQDQGACAAAVGLGIIGRPAANLAKAKAAVERQRRRIALLNLKMHGANALPRQLSQMLGEQQAGMAPPARLRRQNDAENLRLVRRPAREDESIGLAATPEEKAIGQDIALGQKTLEVQGAPCARKGAPMQRSKARRTTRVQRRDPGGRPACPGEPSGENVHRRGSRAWSWGLASGARR